MIKTGCTRTVFLIGRYAIKIPCIHYKWGSFVQGLLCNMQEVSFSKMKDDRICPVLFSLSGGFLLIMPRCLALSESEFKSIDISRFWGKKEKGMK